MSTIQETHYDDLRVSIYPTNEVMGQAAADEAEEIIRAAVRERGAANMIIATGNSQLTFLQALRAKKDMPWPQVSIFHMDEYVNLPPGHSASFPAFLQTHFLSYIQPAAFYPVLARAGQLEGDVADYAARLKTHPADLCAMGIGENGHIAFNDPPYAEFNDPVRVKVIRLAEASRRQQVGEGHFKSLDEVPTHALTLTIPTLLSARRVLCIVPETRKAQAVHDSLCGPITEACPASILRRQKHVHLLLDRDAASLL